MGKKKKNSNHSKKHEKKLQENIEEKPMIEIDLAEDKPKTDFIKVRKPDDQK